jgi:hypothetical protein
MKTKDEIYDEIDRALAAQEEGSKWPGMSFEEGVEAALRWIVGEQEKPIDG